MSKTIVYHPSDWTNLNAPFLESIWKKYILIEEYDSNKKYNPATHIFWTGCLNKNKWYASHYEDGCKVIIDHLWESDIDEPSTVSDGICTLRCRNWIWYNESLWYKSLGYDKYVPNKTYNNSFLMLMNLQRPHRDDIIKRVNLTDAIYSYVGHGITLDDDMEHVDHWQRHLSSTWYNNTSFSLVVETTVNQTTFISEKTFKPLAYYHPFVVLGSPNTLTYLHELGFQTFDYLYNEEYDKILDYNQRIDAICDLVDSMVQHHKTMFTNSRTREVLKHNHDLFFNDSIEQRFVNDIITQILDFVE